MKVATLVLLLALLFGLATQAQSIDNGILLMVTRPSPTDLHFSWTDTGHGPHDYLVYISLDPSQLGMLLGRVHGQTTLDVTIDPSDTNLYFFQVVRAHGGC